MLPARDGILSDPVLPQFYQFCVEFRLSAVVIGCAQGQEKSMPVQVPIPRNIPVRAFLPDDLISEVVFDTTKTKALLEELLRFRYDLPLEC